MTIKMLDLLESLHSLNYVHGDLKYENFVIGRKDRSKIYIIDFGLAKQFRESISKARI